MNKKSLLFVFLLLTATFAEAQNLSVGLRLGLNAANIRGKDVSDTQLKWGPNFGAVLNYSVAEHFGISGEINFTGKGNKVKDIDATFTNNYLEIPIYAAYYFGDGSSDLRPKLFVGPSFGFLMSAKSKIGGTETDLKDVIQSMDTGLVFGAGLHKRMGEGNWLCADLRYNWGLSDIVKNNTGSAVTNGVFSLNVAYTIGL